MVLCFVFLTIQTTSACEPYFDFYKCLASGDTWIPAYTDYQWTLRYVVNAFEGMDDAEVKDNLSAELEIDDPFPLLITHGSVSFCTKGNSETVFLKWDIGDLSPGETAILEILISTDLNPSGRQEYTTPSICGCPETYYELNSGATLWFWFDGHKHSAETGPIIIIAYAP